MSVRYIYIIYIYTSAWISQPFTWLVDTKSYRHLYLVIFCYMVIWYMALSVSIVQSCWLVQFHWPGVFWRAAELCFRFGAPHPIALATKIEKKDWFQQAEQVKALTKQSPQDEQKPRVGSNKNNTKTNLQCHICFFHLPSIQHGMTGHEKPSSTAGGGGFVDNFKSEFPSFSCKKMHFQKVFSWSINSVLEICIAWKDGLHRRLMPARALGSKLSDVLSANIISIALLTRRHLHQLGYSQNMGNSVCFHKRSSSVTRWKGFF